MGFSRGVYLTYFKAIWSTFIIWSLKGIFFCVFWTEPPTPNGPESQPGVEEDVADKEEEGSEDEWEQVGPRNKTSITRQADFVRTPITDIFGGHIRYVDSSLWRCDSEINFYLK